MNERHIILCADDYGISPAVSAAIRDLVARGRLNATSVMVVAPSFRRAEAAKLRDVAAKRAAIGLHVTLTAPFRAAVAGLRTAARTTPSCRLRRRCAGRICARCGQNFWPSRFRDQFEAFVAAFGRPPDFVDGHHHVHLFPQIRDAVLRVDQGRGARRLGAPMRPTVGAPAPHRSQGAVCSMALSRRFRRLAADHGLRTNPAFAGTYTFRSDAAYARLFSTFLDGMPDGGVIMCHPGKVDAELKRLDHVTESARARIRFLRRRRVCAPARRAWRHAVIGMPERCRTREGRIRSCCNFACLAASEKRDGRQSCPQPESC